MIVATGASARQLGLESERTLQGRGVSYCAVCDAAFFRDKQVVVVGGGDSAMEEAVFLTKFATKVSLVHRRSEFRASQIMLDRARNNEKIEFVTPYVVDEVLSENGQTSGVRAPRPRHRRDRASCRPTACSWPIGHDPNTKLFLDQLDHDEAGYLVTKPGSTETNREGVFAAGDVVDHTYRQAVTAAGSGAMAALDAERWLAAREGHAAVRARRAPRGLADPRRTLGRMAEWIDLLDPDRDGAPRCARAERFTTSPSSSCSQPTRHDDEPRPRLEGHDHYVFGVFLVPIAIREEDRVFYQEIDFVATRERLVTVRKTPERRTPVRLTAGARLESRSESDDQRVGVMVYRIVDQIAEYFLDLVDAIDDEIDELEDGIEDWPAAQVRQRISDAAARPPARSSHGRPDARRHSARGRPADRHRRGPGGAPARRSSSTSRTSTTSSCARSTASTSRATCSRAPATTSRRRSPTTRTR